MIRQHRVIYPDEHDPGATNLCALAIMTKAPRAGQVKTRLIPPPTAAEAAQLNSCFLRDISAAIDQAGELARGIGCYTPIGAEEAYRESLPAEFQLIAQRDGDFGQRLAGAIEDLLLVGFDSVCLINSDSPTAPASVFTEAVRILSSPNEQLVLGPSEDGGYYLIGMKNLHSRLFEEIDWSTERVLAQTLERAGEIGIAVRLLPVCYDVDDRTALSRLCDELLGPNESRDPESAPATREFLAAIVAREGRQRIWPTPAIVPAP
jgi:uncharacterized protein